MDQRGFTLLELLVVIAIIGVVLAFVPGFILRGQPGWTSMSRAGDCRCAASGPQRGRAAESGAARSPRCRGPSVPDRGSARAGADRQGHRDHVPDRALGGMSETIGQIRPDGSATGGRIGLALDGQQVEVVVDWLTGLVSVDACDVVVSTRAPVASRSWRSWSRS